MNANKFNMNDFQNMLREARRTDMLKPYNPQVAQTFTKYLNPSSLKRFVMHSEGIQKIIDFYAKVDNMKNARVKSQVKKILDEIGLDRNVAIMRWCGLVLTAVLSRITSGIYVNEKNLNRVKSILGKNPVLYLPSHRSYCDFILMSYVCFCYDIEVPGIAAGMDFHSMFAMGKILRNTGAFFMRRCFSGDGLYWDVFREYMHALITAYHTGVEFFVEGTRSRNFKALMPKVGLLSMALLPYFTGEVSDVTIVPVGVSYDRVLEEQLFVFELLGVPKPKETTAGLLKARKIMDERFGRMYMDFGEPISIKEFFGPQVNRIPRANIPGHLQILNKNDVAMIKDLANEVVYRQQMHIVITTFNLVALFYAYASYSERLVNLDELSRGVIILKNLFEKFGALVETDENSIKPAIMKSVEIHSNLVTFQNANLALIPPKSVDIKTFDGTKLKGYPLSSNTIAIAVPALHIQLYINPCLFWIAKPSFVILAMELLKAKGYKEPLPLDVLQEKFNELRRIFSHEFIIESSTQGNEIVDIIQKLNSNALQREIVFLEDDCSRIMLSAISPFICLYYQLVVTLCEMTVKEFTIHQVLVETQKRIEHLLTMKVQQYVHPYCLALDNLMIAVQSFIQAGYLKKTNDPNTFVGEPESLHKLRTTLLDYCQLLPFNRLYEDIIQNVPSKL